MAAARAPDGALERKSDTSRDTSARVSIGDREAFRSRDEDSGVSITEVCEAPGMRAKVATRWLWYRDTANYIVL
jgi:hypothetical protein